MKTLNCTTHVQLPVEQVVPLTFRAVGQEGPAHVTCLHQELRTLGCTSVLAAQFLVEVPVRLSVTADCDDCPNGSPTEITCMASGVVTVELPLTLGANLGEDTGEAGRILLTPVVTCESTLSQALQIALPLTFGATATCCSPSASC